MPAMIAQGGSVFNSRCKDCHDPAAGDGILPHEVRVPISVEVSSAHDMPGGWDSRKDKRVIENPVVEDPDGVLPARQIFPNEVRLPVSEEISHGGYVPGHRNSCWQIERGRISAFEEKPDDAFTVY